VPPLPAAKPTPAVPQPKPAAEKPLLPVGASKPTVSVPQPKPAAEKPVPPPVPRPVPPLPAAKPTVSVPQPKLVAPVGMSAVELKRRIESVCGRAAREVEVVAQGGKDLQIHLKAANEAAAEQVWNRIKDMPELAPYKVDLRVTIQP
jgi:hypothetical protein